MAKRTEVGLNFDLSPWRSGVRSAGAIVREGLNSKLLSPFDRAVKKSVDLKKRLFGGASKFIKGALTSAIAPILGLLAVNSAFQRINGTLRESLSAQRDYADSVVILQSALKTLDDIKLTRATREVEELGEKLRLSMGIANQETNRAFATLVTRGFDSSQARQLTILAANYAKKTGQPIVDTSRLLAEAANGNTNAMKSLGLEITATGNRVRDGERAVLAMREAYGDIGTDLVNPSELLSAAWGKVYQVLGEKISPILEPMFQGFSDLVTGLTETEEGERTLQKIANWLRFSVNFTSELSSGVSNLAQIIMYNGSTIFNFLKALFSEAIAYVLKGFQSLPGSEWLMNRLGFDPKTVDEMAKGFSEAATTYAERSTDSFGKMMQAGDDLITGRRDRGAVGSIGSIIEAGRQSRENATRSITDEIQTTSSQTFAGRTAIDQQRAADERREKQEREKATKAAESRVKAFAPAGEGSRIVVNVVSNERDRFRRARI